MEQNTGNNNNNTLANQSQFKDNEFKNKIFSYFKDKSESFGTIEGKVFLESNYLKRFQLFNFIFLTLLIN